MGILPCCILVDGDPGDAPSADFGPAVAAIALGRARVGKTGPPLADDAGPPPPSADGGLLSC
eukprot:6426272-Pyramimonas_sp.AAC.1